MAFDLGDVHRCFDVLRAESFVAGMHDAYTRDPSSLGPNTRANYEMGARMSLVDSAWAQAEQTRILQRFQAAYRDYDVILSPTTPVSPFPWTRLYADTVGGQAQANYYRWLALTYVVTLTTHPVDRRCPCGVDHAGMPFGLQVTGGFRGGPPDAGRGAGDGNRVRHLPRLRRPVPDLDRAGGTRAGAALDRYRSRRWRARRTLRGDVPGGHDRGLDRGLDRRCPARRQSINCSAPGPAGARAAGSGPRRQRHLHIERQHVEAPLRLQLLPHRPRHEPRRAALGDERRHG